METYAICLVPRREFVERHLRRAEAERYAELFNRLMRHDGVRAEIVPEPVLADETPHHRQCPACLQEKTDRQTSTSTPAPAA